MSLRVLFGMTDLYRARVWFPLFSTPPLLSFPISNVVPYTRTLASSCTWHFCCSRDGHCCRSSKTKLRLQVEGGSKAGSECVIAVWYTGISVVLRPFYNQLKTCSCIESQPISVFWCSWCSHLMSTILECSKPSFQVDSCLDQRTNPRHSTQYSHQSTELDFGAKYTRIQAWVSNVKAPNF